MKEKIRFLHLADLHLGISNSFLPKDAAKDRSDAFLKAFEEAIDFACIKDNDISFVIIAGDLFDYNKPSSALVEFVRRQFKKLENAEISAFLIGGTHDNLGYPNCVYNDKFDDLKLLTIFKNPNISEPLLVNIKNTDIHFYAFSHQPNKSQPPYDSFEKIDKEGFHMAVIHGSADIGKATDTKDIYVPLKMKNLAETGMDYIALGHYHSYNVVRQNSPMIVYSGCLENCKFGEGEKHFFVVGEIDPTSSRISLNNVEYERKHIFTTESINLDTKQDINNEDDLIKTISSFGGSRKITKLQINGTCEFAFDVEKITEAVKDKFYFIKIEDNTSMLSSSSIKNMSGENTIRGLFVKKILEKIENCSDEEEKKILQMSLKIGISGL